MQDLMTFVNHHLILITLAVILFILLIIVELMKAKRNTTQLTPLEATQLINHEHAVVLDIRPQDSYQQGHIIDAILCTTQELQDNSKKIEKFKAKPLIIVCHTGLESQKMAALLLKAGYNAYSLAGGMRGWVEAQMPLIKEQKNG